MSERLGALPVPDPALSDRALLLRPWQEPDLEVGLAAGYDALISRYRYSLPRTVDAARDWIAATAAERLAGERLELAITQSGIPTGSVALAEVGHGHAMVRYWLLPAGRGRGLACTAVGLTEDLQAGVVDRFRSLPIARSAVLVGRTAADLTVNVVTLLVMLAIGFAVGFRPSQPVYEVGPAFVIVLAFAFAYVFSWISAYVGLAVRDPETAQSVGFIWVFPLVFASSAFVSTSTMPRVVRAFADVNPVSVTVNAALP